VKTFVVRHLDKDRKPRTSRFQAPDLRAAAAKAEAELGPLISIEEETASPRARKTIPLSILAEFTSLLSSLLSAKLSLKDALDIASQTSVRRSVKALATSLSERIGKGAAFSAALDAEGRLPPVYSGLVAVGERTASLPACMERLDGYLRDSKEMRDALGGALVYPAIVLTAATAGIAGVAAYAMPKMREIFAELGGEASERLSTSLASGAVIAAVLAGIFLALVVGAVTALILRARGGKPALAIDKALISLPLAGTFAAEQCMLDFSFAMESLTGGGIPLDAAIPEAAKASRNAFFSSEALAVRDELRKGAALSQAMAASPAFPAYAAQWVAVGERTGEVALVFGRLKSFYSARTKGRTQLAMRIVEPGLSVLLGAILIFIIFTFVLPIFEMMGSLVPVG
jgi:type II secretory pathway component PulF